MTDVVTDVAIDLVTDVVQQTERKERAMKARIQPGMSDFSAARRNNWYYVDKTGFLETFLEDYPVVSLFTRPRRFGKTLMMQMMAEFFDITKDSRELFEGLAVSRNQELCAKWMNQYPVVFLTLKSVRQSSYEDACEQIRILVSFLLAKTKSVLTSPRVDSFVQESLQSLAQGSSNSATLKNSILKNSIFFLCSALYQHYERPVILLIDEYDVPASYAYENGYYTDMIEFMRTFLDVLKGGEKFIKFSVLTGCLRIMKESIFTGLNNVVCYDISHHNYSDAFGFTEKEVISALDAYGLSEKLDEVREWYDGYHFGNTEDIYCPWGIMSYIFDHMTNPDMEPQLYWLNTSGNDIIKSCTKNLSLSNQENIDSLLKGEAVSTCLNSEITYTDFDDLEKNETNLWTLLYITGYLTQPTQKQIEERALEQEQGKKLLIIPNKEIQEVFYRKEKTWFHSSIETTRLARLEEAFWKPDEQAVSAMFSQILMERASFYNYSENWYHGAVAVLFQGGVVASNKEFGLGRPDIVVTQYAKRLALLIEIKYAPKGEKEQLTHLAHCALQQIEDRKYYAGLSQRYHTVLCWGLAFSGKECCAKVEVRER